MRQVNQFYATLNKQTLAIFQLRNSYPSNNLISRSAGIIWTFTKRCDSTKCASKRDQDTCRHSSYLTMILLIGLFFMHTNVVTKMDLKPVLTLTQVRWCIFSLRHGYSICYKNLSHLIFCFSVCDLSGILFQIVDPV